MANFQTVGKWIDTNSGKAFVAAIGIWLLFTYGESFIDGFIDGFLAINK